MKLLLDENLSRRIVPALRANYAGSTQVALLGLERADDRAIWEFAKAGNYVIVTKDDDFLQLQTVLGYPPKVILLTIGNCTNSEIVELLNQSHGLLEAELNQPGVGMVNLF